MRERLIRLTVVSNRRLKFIQLNTVRSHSVLGEISEGVEKVGANVLLQKSYAINGEIKILGSNAIVLTSSRGDDSHWVAVVIFYKEYTILQISHPSNAYCVCAQLKREDQELYFVSSYFQYFKNTKMFLKHLGMVLVALRGRLIVVGANVNAQSALWHSKDN